MVSATVVRNCRSVAAEMAAMGILLKLGKLSYNAQSWQMFSEEF